MKALDLMQSLQDQPFATAIAESPWLFPFFETIHVLALTLVVGSVAMMDLRLLGVGNRKRAITAVTADVLPWTWSAFAVAATTGLLMFSSKAATYYMDIPFRIKVVCLVFAAVNMVIFHFFTARDVSRWDVGPPLNHARVAGAISLCLGVTIVGAGRWMGFMT